MGGLMTTIITRNASIPTKQSEMFSTGADSQDTVEIHVLQGERPFAKDNKSLGIFKLKGIPLAPRGVPKISVTFQLDVNGLLAVSAREEKTGQEQSIKIEGASVLGREEVSKMVKEAEENAALDKAKKSFVSITYELDNLFFKLETSLEKINSLSLSTLSSARLLNFLFKRIKQYYKLGQLEKIINSKNNLVKLEEIINLLILECLTKKISTLGSTEKGNLDGVIDVTDQ
jgi:molecular chaperone DnaK (HSP70)